MNSVLKFQPNQIYTLQFKGKIIEGLYIESAYHLGYMLVVYGEYRLLSDGFYLVKRSPLVEEIKCMDYLRLPLEGWNLREAGLS
jgi:hypothetical protein